MDFLHNLAIGFGAALTATKYADHNAFLLRSRDRLAAVQDSSR